MPVFLPGESSGTEEPGRLQSIGLHRVWHDWSNLTHMHTAQKGIAGSYSSSFFFFFFWLCCTQQKEKEKKKDCRILVPSPGTEPVPLAVKVWSPNHWAATEFPVFGFSLYLYTSLKKKFWGVDLQEGASGVQYSESAIHIHVSALL